MRNFLLVGCLVVFGCDASKKVEAFADRACECKDAKCGKGVLDDFVKWAEDNKDAKGDQDKAAAEAKRMLECVIKAGVEPKDVMEIGERLQKLQ
jgi:hypothetical protein